MSSVLAISCPLFSRWKQWWHILGCGEPKGLVEGLFADPEPTGGFPHRQPLCEHAAGAGQLVGVVATYIERLQNEVSAPSVKQQLAAIRMLFDWLVTGQVVPTNPAHAVRGPKHVVKTGKTPVLEGAEWRKLLQVDPGHDIARSARPGIDRHAHLQLRADQRGLEDEGRGSAAARRRVDDPAA